MFKRELPPEKLELPGVTLAVNHQLKLVILYDTDSSMPDDRYDDLEGHLQNQGYFLQVVVAAAEPDNAGS